MKNSKKFIQYLDQFLNSLGYKRLPVNKGTHALFFKKFDDIYLTLAIEKTHKMPGRFTASFYLAPLFSWSYAPVDEFPLQAYKRIGQCLSVQDRKKVEPDASSEQVDVWWPLDTVESLQQFANLVPYAEQKFLSAKGLQKKVLHCKAMVDLQAYLAAIKREVDERKDTASPLIDKLKMEACVPINWYSAAATITTLQCPLYHHKEGIKMLAEDAWLLYEGQYQEI